MKAAIVTRDNALERPVRSARQVHDIRTEVALIVRTTHGIGVGVVSPQPVTVLGDPGVNEVLESLRTRGVERLRAVGRIPGNRNWAQVHGLFAEAPRDRWAAAAVEAAVLDLEASESRRPWSEILGSGETSFQCVGSLLGGGITVNPLAARYRIKISTNSNLDFSELRRVSVPVLLDFNGDTADVATVAAIVEDARRHANVVGLEQAWAVGDFNRPAELRRAGLWVSHDESIRSVGDVRHAIRYKAVDAVALKPARCGGFAVAREISRRASHAGVECYVGGFFEGPLGRFRNHLLAQSLSAGPSDVLHTQTGLPVTSEEAERDRAEWIERADRAGEWIEVGG